MSGWTDRAHMLADDIRQPGSGAAVTCSSAWRARVDPQATHGLVGAAVALLGNDALTALTADVPPCPDDAMLLHQASELEGSVAEFLGWCRTMAGECQADLDAACGRCAAAGAAIADAEAALARAATPAAEAAANSAITAAMGAQADAMADIADCECAMEILADCEARLVHALNCLRRVPDDLEATYETPYGLVRGGGKLPYDGDFLTGSASAA